jgi:TrpR-related protein YerC/YecD
MTYQSRFENEDTKLLFKAVLALKTEEECFRFFEDICTVNELQSIAQRFHIAKLLSENLTYQEIEEITKASTATISRINRCLKYGAEGYRIALENIRE